MDKDKQLVALKRGFDELADLFVALGDETRQHLIMTLFNLPCKQQGGARVGEITVKTHLSRPVVSHHLKILRLAGVVGMRKEIMKNDYSLVTKGSQWQQLASLSTDLVELIQNLNEGKVK